jgi:hypothetical protein
MDNQARTQALSALLMPADPTSFMRRYGNIKLRGELGGEPAFWGPLNRWLWGIPLHGKSADQVRAQQQQQMQEEAIVVVPSSSVRGHTFATPALWARAQQRCRGRRTASDERPVGGTCCEPTRARRAGAGINSHRAKRASQRNARDLSNRSLLSSCCD